MEQSELKRTLVIGVGGVLAFGLALGLSVRPASADSASSVVTVK